MTVTPAPRNLFEVDNARYLSPDEVVQTFVPTRSFWRLLSAKNHVVLGARGSGKTAMLRMLAHNHLARFSDARARQIIASRSFIGFYLPAKADWVGGLKNKPWLNDADKEDLFRWRLNVASCIAMLASLQSCLRCYVTDDIERIRTEAHLGTLLAKAWLERSVTTTTLRDLSSMLADLDYQKQLSLAKRRARPELSVADVGIAFGTELFAPVRQAIRHASPLLGLPDTAVWMLCLDEAEALEPFHHAVINSYLRTHSDNLVFKVSTTPYGHYTLETNVGAGLSVGNDFEYVYIDSDLHGGRFRSGPSLSTEGELFRKRATASGGEYKRLRLPALLGPSPLLDPREVTPEVTKAVLEELSHHGDGALFSRARELVTDSARFGNEIARKVQGAIALRNAVRPLRGQEEIELYSGAMLVVRCCDGNPRRLIRAFNKLLREGDWRHTVRGTRAAIKPISPKRQTSILRDFSISTLARVQGEPVVGPHLYQLLHRIGRFMRASLHDHPIATDTISSILLDEGTSSEYWRLVKSAVGLGLLYPNIQPRKPDEMPEGSGTFHLAYVLAPAFYLLPRRGKGRRLETILQNQGNEPLPQLDLQLSNENSASR